MWKKIKKLLNPLSDSEEKEIGGEDLITFSKKEPIDVQFTKKFVEGGGLFFYSGDEQETLLNLKEIIDNEQIEEVICFDKELNSLLNRLNVNHTINFNSNSDYAFIKCEYLVAFDGSIMVSSHTNLGRKSEEMPSNLIIFANPGQFVSNISEALQKLKSAKKDNIPTNISSIKGKNLHDFEVSSNSKNIYLILAEPIK